MVSRKKRGDKENVASRDGKLRLVYMKPDDLTPHERNWRRHPDSQEAAMVGVLQEVGWADACLYNERTGRLIDGHLRRKVAANQGTEKIPVLIGDWSEEDETKILATLDPIAAMADADAVALKALLASIETDNEAIQAMLDELASENIPLAAQEGNTDPDAVPEATADPVTKPGDIWILGDHRLMCGDSTDAGSVALLMAGEKAGLCFTSPPYAQQRDYTEESKGQDWMVLMCGVFGNLPMAADGQVLVNLGLVHRDGEWVPYWEPWIEWMREQGWRRFGWYVWDQGSGLPGDWNGRFAPSHEFVFHLNRNATKPRKTVETSGKAGATMGFRKEGGSKECNSPDKLAQPFKIPDSVVRVNRNPGDGKIHPGTFPVKLAAFIVDCWEGICYEPFAGSGSQIIAAQQLGRRCFAMEISPLYVQVALERWAAFTGLQPVLEGTGETLEVVKERFAHAKA